MDGAEARPEAKPGTVRLVCGDGAAFQVEARVAGASRVVRDMLADCGEGEACQEVPLPNVRGEVLAKVLEFAHGMGTGTGTELELGYGHGQGHGHDHDHAREFEHEHENEHEREREHAPDHEPWAERFARGLSKDALFDVLLAANYLDIPQLLELMCDTIADRYIRNKTTQEIRDALNVVNDFTPDELEQVRQENRWLFYP